MKTYIIRLITTFLVIFTTQSMACGEEDSQSVVDYSGYEFEVEED